MILSPCTTMHSCTSCRHLKVLNTSRFSIFNNLKDFETPIEVQSTEIWKYFNTFNPDIMVSILCCALPRRRAANVNFPPSPASADDDKLLLVIVMMLSTTQQQKSSLAYCLTHKNIFTSSSTSSSQEPPSYVNFHSIRKLRINKKYAENGFLML